jgi:hypothetical protein
MKRLVIILCLLGPMLANGQALITKLSYAIDQNQAVTLSLTVVDEEEEEPVEGLSFDLFSLGLDTVQLGTAVTDENGKGNVIIDKSTLQKQNSFINLMAVFSGSEWDANELLASVKDIDIQIIPEEEEDSKSLIIQMQTWGEDGEIVPLEEGEGIIYIQRLFSLLPIDSDVWTEEDGTYAFDFPDDLPGDENGELEVIFTMDSHEDFGTVVVAKRINWGIPQHEISSVESRALWSNHAPLWMVLTFWILMSAVWLYYIKVMYNIYLLK